MTRRTRALGPLLAITTMGMLAACSSGHGDSDKATAASTKNKTGILEIAAGDCGAAAPAGSWFRMVQPGGSPQRGPYVENGDSPCTDKAVTPLLPGADRGLRIGTYQPQPNPAFGTDGGSLS